jgi:HK97 family phage portal protein
MTMSMPRPPMLMVDEGALTPGRGYNLDAAIRDLSGQWYATMGIDRDQGGLGLATTPESYAGLTAEEPWVYAVINRVALDAQSVPLLCWAKKGKARIRPEDNPGDKLQAAIQELIDNVNNQSMSGADLKAWHIVSEYTYGEDYWLALTGRFGGGPQELHWLRPSNVTPITAPGSSVVTALRYTGEGSVTDYDPRKVIAYRTPNPRDPTHGQSFLQAVKYDVSVDRQAAMWTAHTLANWGMPAIAWVAPKGADIAQQDMSAIRRVLRSLRGPRAAGKTGVLPEGIEPKVLSLNPKDAEWLQARKVARMTICAAAGVPLVLVGDDDKNTVYGNLRDAQRVYWRGTLIPKLTRWSDWLSYGAPVSLLDMFGPTAREKYVIAFDFTNVEALRPELTSEMNAYVNLMGAGVVTPNESRRHFNIGQDVKWGDDPLRSTRLVSEPPDELPPGAPQVEIGKVSVIPTSATAAGAEGVAPLTPPTAPTPPVALRESPLPRNLYRQPAVKAWLDDTTAPIDAVAAALGVPASDALRVGLQRRYSADQLWNGYAPHGFRGLKEI